MSLALDPHPPPETPSATESLEVSMATEGTPVQEPTLPRVPPVLKDMTNIQRVPGEKSPVKKPGTHLFQDQIYRGHRGLSFSTKEKKICFKYSTWSW